MLNAFALRSRDPKALYRTIDPVGPDNTLEYLRTWCEGTTTIACWGANIANRGWGHRYRGHEICEAIPWVRCLRKTRGGHPEHPFYLPGHLRPQAFSY